MNHPLLKRICLMLVMFGAAAPACHAATSSSLSDEIVGGVSVNAQDPVAQSVVALYRQTGSEGALCSATLIAKNMALTAAHCVDQGTDGMVVIFGTDIQADARDAVQVIGAEIQPAWSQAHPDDQDMGDIAVVRFASDAPESFKPAHLASKKMSLKAGDTVTLAGYGITRANSQKGVGVLRKVDVKVLNPSLGETEMVLDQSDGSGACHGDSGGPAFLVKDGKTYLVGVTNRSYPDTAVDDCKHQVVYTKVMPYRSWIADSEKELKRMK